VTDKNRKIAVAKADGTPGEPPVVMLGIPAGAWEHMKDGDTHHFDLTKTGIPVKFVLFGGPDYPSVIETLNVAAQMLTGTPLGDRDRALHGTMPDLGIDEPTKQ